MKRKKILVAEDSQEVKEALSKALGEIYELTIVSTPQDAINYDKPFDLLLTDFTFKDRYGKKMEKQGLNIIEQRKEKDKGLAAILMSSGLNNGMISACEEMGAETFRKYEDDKTPIDGEKLKRTIEKYVRK